MQCSNSGGHYPSDILLYTLTCLNGKTEMKGKEGEGRKDGEGGREGSDEG